MFEHAQTVLLSALTEERRRAMLQHAHNARLLRESTHSIRKKPLGAVRLLGLALIVLGERLRGS
ncbi:MAG: hypothetical protein JO101_05505 [Candidatus Eremiobacteraeota bacterium]|nr:hypothetical protein [Candidatus Eremiobacteraeota bacterium]MBV8354753.1 hypothetical protein [Candidatus Eremiobacteraeota bacterium]